MTRSDEPLDPSIVVRAAVDVLVYAPLGLGVKLVEDAPDALGKARRELSNARFIGRLAVDQGIKQIRSRREPSAPTFEADSDAEQGDDREPPAPPPAEESARSIDEMVTDPSADDLSADDLALPDYDTLPAIDIVAKLETLDAADRDAIERYEAANRQRRTVLGKLAQLATQ